MLLLIQYTLIFSSVLILVALGGCISEHSGVINLGLEGIMVIGALGGALMMRFCQTESAFVMVLLVILAAAFFGLVYSALLGVACINFKADQTLVGTALNLLGTAAATVFVKALNTSMNPDDHSSEIEYVRARKMFITNINGFEFNWFMLIAVIAVIVVAVMLYRTRFGLRLMACGEHPQAADSVGINVYKMRWAGVLLSGILGGLGGICYILAGVSIWKFENGVAGFGFLALAVMIFGQWKPGRIALADLRPVEARTHCAGGAAVRSVPRSVEHLCRLPLSGCSESPGQCIQHDALYRFPDRARPDFQELPRPEG